MEDKIEKVLLNLNIGYISVKVAKRKLLKLIEVENLKRGTVYTEKEVANLLQVQRGNCYVAILSKTEDQELAKIAGGSPEPGGGKW